MEFDEKITAAAFIVVIAVGVGALLGAPEDMGMAPRTVLTMVLPSMAIFGAIMLAIGVKYGEYRVSK